MNWRLILDGAYSGAWNMARDEALLLCQNPSTPPVLRFYNWNSACVSLGRLQKNFDFSRLQESRFDLVRRPTGGRAVLHQHEITYCAVLHKEVLPRDSRSVIGAYQWLSEGFLEGLRTLGIEARLSPGRGVSTHHASTPSAANCFESSTQCDFLVDGRKLIGAAQCRKHDAILQHGAILLEVDPEAWGEAVGGAMEEAASLRGLGVLDPRDDIIAALRKGMEQVWDISFRRSELSQEEREVASRLHTHKYSSSEWNERGLDLSV